MLYKDDEFLNDRDNHSEQKPNAYRVDDDNNVEEKDLKRSFTADETKPVMEGKPMGGENFGANNVTPAGDDKNNPSQNAGYSNAYFKRTEPSEEHPENSNFKPEAQQGESDYDKAMPRSATEGEGGNKTGNDKTPEPNKVTRKAPLTMTAPATPNLTYPALMRYPISKKLVRIPMTGNIM